MKKKHVKKAPKPKTKPVPMRMPLVLDNDHGHVKALVEESVRINMLGEKWLKSKPRNPMAAEMCFRNGWAYSLAAAWLRCLLKGEVK